MFVNLTLNLFAYFVINWLNTEYRVRYKSLQELSTVSNEDIDVAFKVPKICIKNALVVSTLRSRVPTYF